MRGCPEFIRIFLHGELASSMPPCHEEGMYPLLLIYVTVPDERFGWELARDLVSSRLAACANLQPAGMSFYDWNGQMNETREHILLLKTTVEKADDLVARVLELHPFDCPCILRIPVEATADFADWVARETT
jgi:periplasmic divalent cation tolerance protein